MKKIFTVTIEGLKHSLSIDQNDEEVMRRSVKQLQEKLAELSVKYECSSYDRLAMAAILLAIENEELRMQKRYSDDNVELQELTASVRRALGE